MSNRYHSYFVMWLLLFGMGLFFQPACSSSSLEKETIDIEPQLSDSGLKTPPVKIEQPIETTPQEPEETVYTIQSGDTFLGILQKHGIPNRRQIVDKIAAVENLSWDVTKIQPKNSITFIKPIDEQPYFTIQVAKHQRLLVKYTEPIEVLLEEDQTEVRPDIIQKQISSSFWLSASQMKLNAVQILQIVKVFETHIDFGTEIYGGEVLTLWADRIYLDNEPIGVQKIYSVIFQNKNTSTQLFQVEIDNKMVWLDNDGRSVNRPFLRSPVEYNHISSKFGVKRKKGYHGGVDFAAKKGVPVRAVANGKVKLANWNGGYGKQVQLEHPEYGSYLTSYAHLSKIKVKKGQIVKQGDIIGLVGSTGQSTGPHVHYELKVKGKRVNPLEYQLPNAHEIKPEQKATFDKQITKMKQLFSSGQTLLSPL